MPGRAKHIRKYERVPYHEKVFINDSIAVLANDLSEGGLYVHTSRSLLPGSTVTVTFPAVSLTVRALVQYNPSQGGLGLMFTELSKKQAAQLRRLIQRADELNRAATVKKKRILVVEDCLQGVCYRSRLAADGFYVLRATDVAEATRMLRTQRPDVVVLALQEAEAEGRKVLSFLRRSPNLRDIPAIVFSSKFSAEDQMKALASGADKFLPLMTTTPARMAEIVRRLLAQA